MATKRRNRPPPGTEEVVRTTDIPGRVAAQAIGNRQLFSNADHLRGGRYWHKMTQPSHKLGAHPLIEFLSGMLSFPAKLRIRAWATSSPS